MRVCSYVFLIGLCGTLPRLRRAIPRDTNHTGGFPINAEVTYKCVDGCVKIPGKSDSVVCLPNSEWSSIGEFCDRKYFIFSGTNLLGPPFAGGNVRHSPTE